MRVEMKFAPNSVLGLSMTVGALIAAVGLGLQSNDVAGHLQAAPATPVQVTAESPSPPPPPPPTMTLAPNDDYWTGQGSAGGAPGAGGGG
jgi:hypothetical protein